MAKTRPETQTDLPDLEAYSVDSVRKAVRNESFLHPLVLYPTAFGMLTGFAALLYNLPLLFLGMGGLLAVGAGTSVVNYFFRQESISGKYIEKLSKKFERQRELLLEKLGQDLRKSTVVPGAEQYARQGVEQYTRIEKKYRRMSDLLQKKFKRGELTYGSFLGASEQVYLSVLDNLLKIVSLLQGVESIDPVYIAERRKELALLPELAPADERELEALEKRMQLRKKQLDQINGLLTENEESMTVLDETIAAVAEVTTGKNLAEVDLHTAMAHLKEIAGRTKMFDYKNGRQNTQAHPLASNYQQGDSK